MISLIVITTLTHAYFQLSVEQLSDMLAVVDRPLRICKPNRDQIAEMCIPLNDKYELHIVDVASALIKKILGKYY